MKKYVKPTISYITVEIELTQVSGPGATDIGSPVVPSQPGANDVISTKSSVWEEEE